jgi:hypothetical protein
LIEHRNKHIVTFFGQLVHTVILWQVIDILGAKWYYVQAFLNLTLEKTIKQAKGLTKWFPRVCSCRDDIKTQEKFLIFTKQFFLFKQDKLSALQ